MHYRFRLDRYQFQVERKKSWCRSLTKSLELFTNDPLNRRPKVRPLYGLQAYMLHDLVALRRSELIVAEELEEEEENHTSLLYYED